MKYNIRCNKEINNSEAIKKYILEKLSKLDKYFSNSENIEANVLTKQDGRLQRIEVTIPTPHFTLRNEVSNDDLYAAIDIVSDKLERQIRKNKDKINRKVNKKFIEEFEYDLEDEYYEDQSIVKHKKIELKPIDEEEAIIQMNMLGHTFFVYKDVDTEKICVLYKRKDNNYGVIETE